MQEKREDFKIKDQIDFLKSLMKMNYQTMNKTVKFW